MKKKILFVISSCLLMLCFVTGCQKEGTPTPSLTVTTESIPEATPDAEGAMADSDSSVSESIPVENLTAEQQNMLAVMDSLNMCMVENNLEYAPENPDFLWTALFYAIGNYPALRDNEANNLLTMDYSTGTIIVYYKLVQEYATGLTERYSDLPPFPEGAPVSQNADTDYYHFPMGDRGLSYGEIASWTINGDGTHTVECRLMGADDNSLIAAFEYILTDNSYAEGITDPMFLYTVRSVRKLEP